MKTNDKLKELIAETQKLINKKVSFYEKWHWRTIEWMWAHLPMHKIHKKWYVFLIRLHGFKAIKCVDYMGEYTFIFKTNEESNEAFKKLEQKKGLVVGWWYGEEEFKRLTDD